MLDNGNRIASDHGRTIVSIAVRRPSDTAPTSNKGGNTSNTGNTSNRKFIPNHTRMLFPAPLREHHTSRNHPPSQP